MATAGPNIAGTGANDASSGTTAWGLPDRITADDANYTEIACIASAESQWLKATNFGFAISGTVTGVTAGVYRQNTTGQLADAEVRLVFAGSIDTLGGDRSAGANWSGSFTLDTFGGTSDTWDNMTITDAQVNNSGFGFAIRCVDTTSVESEGAVDYMQLTITYTPTPGGIASAVSRRVSNLRRM